jgi:hypothetical protein
MGDKDGASSSATGIGTGTRTDSSDGSQTPKGGDGLGNGSGEGEEGGGGKSKSRSLIHLGRRNPRTGIGSIGSGRRGGLGVAGSQAERLYPMPTVIIVALISFLIGSLLRSLLSPAEFVGELPSGGEVAGKGVYEWREIKRLVEIKYLVGGWDFVVAVVRRH